MKTSRKNVVRDRRQSECFNSTLIGYSTYKLRKGDLFLYKEIFKDGSDNQRMARCHGRVKPTGHLNEKWYILAQAMSDNMSFTYERWIDPEEVVEIIPQDRANEHIMEFFKTQES